MVNLGISGIWRNNRIKTIKWSDFFRYEKNEMVTYRLTPHQSVTNNTNRKLWRQLHKMYLIYESKLSRLTRKGLRFSFREKDVIWYDVVFRVIDGEKRIEFYVSTAQLWSKKLRETIEDRMKVTIEEVERETLQVPQENTVVQELRYLRNDIFSLHTDATEQTSPISSILSAVDDLSEDGDFARLSIATETINHRKWAQNAAYAHDKLAKGVIPQRGRMSLTRVSKGVKNGIAKLIYEVHSLVTDVFKAVEKSFIKSDSKDIETPEIKPLETDTTRLGNKSAAKRYQPVWRTHIRIAAHCNSKLRTDLVANTISSAFGELGEDNELHRIKIRVNGKRVKIIEELNTLQLSAQTKADGDANLMSCDELAKIALQLPTRDVQMRYEDALSVNRKVETEVPAVFRGKGITLGHSEFKGDSVPVKIPVKNYDELFRTYVFQGSQGMGKDTALKNFVIDACLEHGIGSIVPDAICEDGSRGLADGLRDALPADKIVDLDLSNVDWPVPMDLTEIVAKLGRNGVNRFAQEIIDFFGDLAEMARSRAILREAAKASGGSLLAVKLLLENEEYRARRVKKLREEGNERLAEQIEGWGDNKKLGAKADAILYRLDELFGDDALLHIFAQDPHPDVNFEKWIAEGKVVILRIPNRKLGTLATKTLMHWIVLKTFMTKLLMDRADIGCFLVFNEPHQYMTDGLQRLLQRLVLEGRKWRLGSLFAFHHVGLLPRAFADDLQASGTNWFLFANTHKGVYERLSEELSPTFDVESAMQTERYHAICLLQFGGRRQHPFLVRMAPPPTQTYDNSFLTARHSRMYGRKWTEVERMILERERGAS
ncbi:ATP-binding protein [Fictibacillus sp. Mic-4]|uniref:ATP-binding protein n=1 Tax=Fictibacillus sp. Mic-4 TaxID=3132826 RepID=UPI003CE95290